MDALIVFVVTAAIGGALWRRRGGRNLFPWPVVLVLSACSGNYGGGHSGASGGSSGSAQARSMEEHFTNNVQPSLQFCRSCHVPGGVADVEKGRRFQLGSDPAQDLALLKASWERLGGNHPTSRILLMASGQETPHTGGAPWPKDSAAYKNMSILLQCFGDPGACAALLAGGSGPGTQFPLLAEGHRGGHAWNRYCAGKPDDAALPPDPRSLVQPGVNAGKAVYFNAWYKNCHVNAGPEDAAPATCGQWRARIERGAVLMKGNGAVGAGLGGSGNSGEGAVAIPANFYNELWRRWGLTERPANFDELVAQRWGTALAAERNPYPLPGEDPNATNGGSGQLPMALTQVRGADGSWTGDLAVNCHICHSSMIGERDEAGLPGPIYGTNSQTDLGVIVADLALPTTASVNRVRGTGNITNFQGFFMTTAQDHFTDTENFPAFLQQFVAPSTAAEDFPNWWNYGHRPLKFFDGGMSSDAQRIVISAFFPAGTGLDAAKAWIEQHDQDAAAWVASLGSPAWPGPVDTALAEQGAILFHSKDLWAADLNNTAPKPKGGNGSCASCHGAYSPRFVHDPGYLETPELEGIAGHIAPRDLIGTDPARVDGNNQAVSETWQGDWFGYPEQRGTDQDCGDQNLDRIRGERENGYLAPPLYGVWASAPYFHNGAVPNVWEVLKSPERKAYWRRASTPNDSGLNVVMGFDTRFGRAYDQGKLGWNYDEVACDATGVMPVVECNPTDDRQPSPLQEVLSGLYGNGGLLWNATDTPALTNDQVEHRKIYNTRLYSQDNGGHTFTDVLTDPERRAIIEYLKTL